MLHVRYWILVVHFWLINCVFLPSRPFALLCKILGIKPFVVISVSEYNESGQLTSGGSLSNFHEKCMLRKCSVFQNDNGIGMRPWSCFFPARGNLVALSPRHRSCPQAAQSHFARRSTKISRRAALISSPSSLINS